MIYTKIKDKRGDACNTDGDIRIGMYRMLPSELPRMTALVTSNRVWKDEGLYETGVTETE
jgi:hypothetical protein